MSAQAWGALSGLVAAAGLLLVASWLGARRPLTVSERIAPFVRPGRVSGNAGSRGGAEAAAWSTLWLLVRPARTSARGRVAAEADRLQRVTWAVLGSAAGAGTGIVLTVGGSSPIGVLVLGVAGGVAGYLLEVRHVAALARQRRTRIDQHFPDVAELIAFAVAAGESPVAALERVCASTSGDLSDELAATVADVRSGAPLDDALLALGERAGSVPVQRFVEGLVVAMERGTPLSDVLRAQAADARADDRRRLMELAGRKDVLMLVPVVFLILPTVVLVALFPGIQALRLVVA